MDQLKEHIEGLTAAFEEFKVKNNARLDEVEKNGRADPLLEQEVNRINDKITELSDGVESHKALKNRVDDLEAELERATLGGSNDPEAVAKAQRRASEFMSAIRDEPVEATADDIEAVAEYIPAFQHYLRRGERGLPADMQAAMSVGSDPEGGYWVQPDVSGRIVELVYETSPMRQHANVETIGTDALEGTNDLDEADSGWVGEQESRDDTDEPDTGEWRIPVHEIYAQPSATQKMLDDSIRDVEGWLANKVSRRFRRQENAAFVNGNGIKKPRGFLTYPAGVPTATGWNVIEQIVTGANGGFAASDPGDFFHTMIGSVKTDYLLDAIFAMNRTTLAESRKLKDGDGTYLWEKSFDASQPFQLLGFPVAPFEDMPAIGTGSLSIAFGSFMEAYQIVDRTGIRVLRDPFTTKGRVKFYTTKRVGGDVLNFEAIKIGKFSAS